jgi:sigma-B regulation protein RsbU (phosphoserine phosphatase)
VAGDLYDFFAVAGGRLAFLVGDVSGKGMPAALFMVAVRTLCRHLAQTAQAGDGPAQTLRRLNEALAADNPSGMFVTLTHGLYHPDNGGVVLASGGHPAPLLRHADGRVEELAVHNGRLLGFDDGDLHLNDMSLVLAPGQTLVFYTDGVTEAHDPERRSMFGTDRLKEVVSGFDNSLPLEACAEKTRATVEQFTASHELQDDVTVLLLRRRP